MQIRVSAAFKTNRSLQYNVFETGRYNKNVYRVDGDECLNRVSYLVPSHRSGQTTEPIYCTSEYWIPSPTEYEMIRRNCRRDLDTWIMAIYIHATTSFRWTDLILRISLETPSSARSQLIIRLWERVERRASCRCSSPLLVFIKFRTDTYCLILI